MALAAVLLTAPVSHGAALAVTDGSWFWAEQPDPLPQAGYQPLAHPDVPSGDFAAAAANGNSDKETFLHIDTSSWADGTTVSKFILTVKEDPNGRSIGPDLADGKVRAAAVVEYFAGSTEGGPYSQKPATVKSDAADGHRAADGTWTFDLTAIAAKWASGALQNNGLGLVPNATQSDNFQVVWQGASTMQIDAEVSTPSSSASNGSDSFPVFGSSGSTADTTPVTAAPGNTSDLSGDVSSNPVAATSAPPATTNPPTTAVALAPVRGRATAKSNHGLPLNLLLVVVFVIGLAAAGAVALGELGEPAAPRRGSVMRRLERSPE